MRPRSSCFSFSVRVLLPGGTVEAIEVSCIPGHRRHPFPAIPVVTSRSRCRSGRVLVHPRSLRDSFSCLCLCFWTGGYFQVALSRRSSSRASQVIVLVLSVYFSRDRYFQVALSRQSSSRASQVMSACPFSTSSPALLVPDHRLRERGFAPPMSSRMSRAAELAFHRHPERNSDVLQRFARIPGHVALPLWNRITDGRIAAVRTFLISYPGFSPRSNRKTFTWPILVQNRPPVNTLPLPWPCHGLGTASQSRLHRLSGAFQPHRWQPDGHNDGGAPAPLEPASLIPLSRRQMLGIG